MSIKQRPALAFLLALLPTACVLCVACEQEEWPIDRGETGFYPDYGVGCEEDSDKVSARAHFYVGPKEVALAPGSSIALNGIELTGAVRHIQRPFSKIPIGYVYRTSFSSPCAAFEFVLQRGTHEHRQKIAPRTLNLVAVPERVSKSNGIEIAFRGEAIKRFPQETLAGALETASGSYSLSPVTAGDSKFVVPAVQLRNVPVGRAELWFYRSFSEPIVDFPGPAKVGAVFSTQKRVVEIVP